MLKFIESIPSTNTYLLKQGEQLASSAGVYTTHQTAGKGRRGRIWQEQAGKSLALSCVYHLPADLQQHLFAVPLVAGVSVCETLERMFPMLALDLGLKWSNDILLQEKKLGGILCESKLQQSSTMLVVGVGINLFQSPADFAEQNLPSAISLHSALSSGNMKVETLAHSLSSTISENITRWQQEGFSPFFKEEYQRRCLTLGRQVLVYSKTDERQGEETKKGKAISVGSDGALSIIIDGEEQEFFAGDVKIRGENGYI